MAFKASLNYIIFCLDNGVHLMGIKDKSLILKNTSKRKEIFSGVLVFPVKIYSMQVEKGMEIDEKILGIFQMAQTGKNGWALRCGRRLYQIAKKLTKEHL